MRRTRLLPLPLPPAAGPLWGCRRAGSREEAVLLGSEVRAHWVVLVVEWWDCEERESQGSSFPHFPHSKFILLRFSAFFVALCASMQALPLQADRGWFFCACSTARVPRRLAARPHAAGAAPSATPCALSPHVALCICTSLTPCSRLGGCGAQGA